MAKFETISLAVDDRGVATITLAREEKHNALSAIMMTEIGQAVEQLNVDDTVRVVVLTGKGRSFCAGGDLDWMRAQMAADSETRAKEGRRLANMLFALNTLSKPLIGRIQGQAFGGGIGMACVCDVAVGVDTAKFGLTETRLGLIPATIGPYVIARMGEAMARRVFMSSRIFGAQEAVTLGILAKAVEADVLEEAIEAEITPYLNCAPRAVANAKSLARKLGHPITQEIIEMSIDALIEQWAGDEAPEGVAAFFEKRKPLWAH